MVWLERVNKLLETILFAFFSCAAVGLIAGFMAGLMGIGGGLIIVPFLSFVMPYWGFQEQTVLLCAIATSLSTIIFTGISSFRAHYKNGNVEFDKLLPLLTGIAMATTTAALMAEKINPDFLKIFFSVCLALLAIKMAFIGNPESAKKVGRFGLLNIGVFTGGISSLLGIGGGAILVPTLVWFNVDIKKAIGSAAVTTVAVALFGAIGYVISGFDNTELPPYSLGYIYLPAMLGIIATSVFTAPVGANLANRLDVAKLKKLFAIFLICVAIRMLFS